MIVDVRPVPASHGSHRRRARRTPVGLGTFTWRRRPALMFATLGLQILQAKPGSVSLRARWAGLAQTKHFQ